MDGANVNWKTVEMIKKYQEHNDSGGPDLAEIGNCGLHVLQGTCGTAQKATGWNLDTLLKAVHSIFKFLPERRED